MTAEQRGTLESTAQRLTDRDADTLRGMTDQELERMINEYLEG